MQSFFHCAPLPLGAGSVVQPGNWGRVLRLYAWNPNQIVLNAWREALLEQAHDIYAPQKPSRLAATFALPSQQEAVEFRNKHATTSLIYEVEPVSLNPNTHEGDYELAIAGFSGQYFQELLDFPRRYWTIPPAANREILFDCGLRVIAQVP